MDDDEDEGGGIPEWVVTFGDMMSLLLTFFIMLVSMSEIKKDEKFQATVESIRQQFGHDGSPESISPGDNHSRTSAASVLATTSRAKKKDTASGGVPTKAPVGEDERVRIIRHGESTAIGTVIFFEDGSIDLNDEAKANLDKELEQMSGKPQKIELRGHTAQQLGANGPDPVEAMDLGYRRARSVMSYLVEKHGIPPARIRPSTGGAWEPMYLSSDSEKLRLNPRVEVFLLDETVDQLVGTVDERADNVVN